MILRRNRSSLEANSRLSVSEKRRRLRNELLEERRLLAVGPQLLGIDHNNGLLVQEGSIFQTAPNELTFRFEEGDDLDPATLSAIKLIRSGSDGIFNNGNDVEINPGFLDLGQTSYTVIMRFQTTLPDDSYRISIQGTGANALRNANGDAFGDSTDDGVDNGQNFALGFELQLGAQIVSVVPQPVTRDPDTGELRQAKDQIEVYFNDDTLDPTTVSNPSFYRLIDTQSSAIQVPTAVDFDATANMVTLTFAADLSTATYELQIGASDEANDIASDSVDLGTINQQATAATYESPERLDQDGNVVPTAIPDNGSVISAISVIESFFIDDLNVELNIDHEWGPDLRVFLQGPGGQRIEMVRDVGSQVRGGQIYGSKFDDLNGDGIRDEEEPGLPGWTIFIDTNLNGELDPGELSTVTDSEGRYSFLNLPTDQTYWLVEQPQAFWESTAFGSVARPVFSTDFSQGSVQTLRLVGNTVDNETEGDFRLGFGDRSTGLIEFGGIDDPATTAANIQEALEELLDPGVSVVVTPDSGTEFTIEFAVSAVGTPIDHPALVVVDNQLSDGQLEIINTGDNAGFTSSGDNNLWHLSEGRSQDDGHTPQWSFYFGENETATGGGSYVNNAQGVLRSPEIDLTDLTIDNPQLVLNHFLSTESGFDFAEIRVVADGEETVLLNTSTSTSGWQEIFFNLGQFVGKRIHVEFEFTSDGSVLAEGWYIDDVVLQTRLGAQPVFLSSSPQGQVVKNVNLGSQAIPSSQRDQFGYQAYQVNPEFQDITGNENAQSILQQYTDTGLAVQLGGSGDESHRAFAADSNGNIYVTGSFQGTVDFDLGAGTTNLTSAGGNDVFVAKYDSAGVLQWARQAGGTSSDVATSIVIDSLDNVIVAGSYSATANFGGTNLTSNGSTDAFVWKLDDAGNTTWARGFGGNAIDEARGVDVLASNDIAITGFFSGTVDFDPNAGDSPLTSAGQTDIFVMRMSSLGNLSWARRIGGTGADRGEAIHVTDAGNITTTGSYSNTVDFNPGGGVVNRTSQGSTDVFIQQMNGSGTYRWVQTTGSPLSDRGTAVDSDADGRVVATGTLNGNILVGGANADGTAPFFDQFGGTATDVGEAIRVDRATEDVIVAGSFRGTVDFGDGTDRTSVGGSDAFLLTIGLGGITVNTFGGPLDDVANDVIVEDQDSLLLAGDFRGTADFDVGTSTETLTSNGSSDAFLARIARVVGLDDGAVELTAADLNGFAFDFYGILYDSLFVSSNGLISFTAPNDSSDNTDLLLTPDEPTIAAFWEDLRTGSASAEAVFWEVVGTGNEQRLIVQWNGVQLDNPNASSVGPLNFQAILSERDGSIQFNYQTVADPQVIPAGPAEPVGTFTVGSQTQPVIASDAAGNYVIAWTSPNQDGEGNGVYARRYDANGVAQGPEFLVNQTTAGDQQFPKVAMTPTGGFVIAWHGNGPGDADGIFARVFAANGTPVTNEILVNRITSGAQLDAWLGIDDAGNFTVAWHGEGADDTDGVYQRRFNFLGQPLGIVDEIQRISFLGPPNNGSSYTLIHDGAETGVIAFSSNANQNANTIQNALRGLPNTGNQLQVVPLANRNEIQLLELSESPIVEDEVQTITFTGNPTGGTFQLDFGGTATADITYAGAGAGATTASNIQIALEGLAAIGAGNIVVAQVGASDIEFTVTFTGTLGGSDVALLTVAQNNLDQGNISILETTMGTSGGSFELAFQGVPTGPIQLAGAGTAANIQAALEALANIGAGNVVVRAVAGSDTDFEIEFQGVLGNLDVDLLEVIQSNLDQGTVSISELRIGSAQGRDFEVRFLGADGGINQPPLSLGLVAGGVTHLDTRTVVHGDSGVLRVNNQTTDVQRRARMDMLGTGESIVIWESNNQDGSGFGVFAKRFDANGVSIEEEFDEVQRLTIDGPPNAGSIFRLRMGGQGAPTTAFITYFGANSGARTAAAIEAAIQALPGYAEVSVESITSFGASNEIQELTFTAPLPAAGTFRLSHRGLVTAPIVFQGNQAADAAQTATNIQDALRALANTAADQITVVPRQDGQGNDIPFQFVINFVGPVDGGINHPPLVFLDNQLNQGAAVISTIDDGGTSANEFIVSYNGTLGRQDQPEIELATTTGGVTSITVEEVVKGANAEFQVNVETFNDQNSGDLAIRDDGSYLIVWNSIDQDGDAQGVFGKLYAANGDVLRDEFQINSFTEDAQARPRVGTDAAGNFVVTWRSNLQDGDEGGIYARRLGADGFPLADEFQVHTITVGDQAAPAIAVNSDGKFTVAWQSEGLSGGIRHQRFEADETPIGGEEQVSQFGLREQDEPSIARNESGDYVVVWSDLRRDADNSPGIYAQLFDSNGNALTGEIHVNETIENFQGLASVAIDDAGNFIVVWNGDLEVIVDGESTIDSQIFARRFDSNGNPQGGEFQVNSVDTNLQVSPSVAMDADSGEFVVAWTYFESNGDEIGIQARLFDAMGIPVGDDFDIAPPPVEGFIDRSNPLVDMNRDGTFVVAWSQQAEGNPNLEAYARIFDSAGQPITDAFEVDPTDDDIDQIGPDVGIDDAGNVTVAWISSDFSVFMTSIRGRQFDAAGNPFGAAFLISDTDSGDYGTSLGMRLDSAGNGSFTVVWNNNDQGLGIQAQRFGEDGSLIGDNFRIDEFEGDQNFPSVGVDSSGLFTVAWFDTNSGVYTRSYSSDTSSVGIKAGGSQNPGEEVLQIWVDGSRTDFVGNNRSTRIIRTAPTPGRLFAIDGANDELLELDSVTGVTLNSYPLPIPAGSDAGLAYAGGTVYFIATGDTNVHLLDPDTGGLVSTVPLDGVTANGLAYLNGEVVVLDTTTGDLIFVDPMRAIETARVTPAVAVTSGLVGSGARGTLFAIDAMGQIVELGADGSLSATWPSPGGTLTGLAFVDGMLLVSNDAGDVLQINPDTGGLLGTLAVPAGISALGADGGGGVAQFKGGDYQPFVSTILDDEGTLSITEGVGPFSGRYVPLEPLSTFDRTNVRGSWRLEIQDTASGDTGVLHNWKLLFNEPQDTAPDFSQNGIIGDSTDLGLAAQDDVDIYRFDTLVGGTITVDVAPQGGLDAAIRLFDSQGNELVSVDAAGVDGAEQLIHVAMDSGTYFVGISSTGNTAYNIINGSGKSGGTTSGSYTMDLRFSEPISSDDDNSSYATAIPIGVLGAGGQRIRAEIRSEPYDVELPGSNEEPGHRQIPVETHLNAAGGHNHPHGQILLGFSASTTPQERNEILNRYGLELVKEFEFIDSLVVRPRDGSDAFEKINTLRGLEQVRYADPDSMGSFTLLPNDPQFPQQWHYDNQGQTGGTVDADIDLPEAWDTFTGSAQTVIAVLDSGVDYNHPDLAANMWVNPGEIPGDGIDNDGNGYVDDIHGIDPGEGDSDPFDNDGHGTHVAGTTSAVGNNGLGVTGVNWNAKIMALKVGNAFGGIPDSAVIEALNYMVTMKTVYGVNIVVSNNSYGGAGFAQATQDAIQASIDAGIPFVAAAGNFSIDNDVNPFFPASYPLDGIISVAASDDDDNFAGFSHFGATSVDIAAPGVGILSTTLGGGYGLNTGTSMASPHVAGAVGLLAGFAPGATVGELKSAIMLGGDPLPNMTGLTVSGARLNVANSLDLIGVGVSSPLGGAVQTVYYNFQDIYGTLPSGSPAVNAITENQKQRAREIFEFYGDLVGLEFIETADEGLTVVTGDLRVVSPTAPTGPGGVVGISDGSLGGTVIMDAAENWGDSEYGGAWFQTAMHEIGHSMGLGHAYDLPNLTIMGGFGVGEPVFPGDHDIVHARHIHEPASIDIDLYAFSLNEDGYLTAETIAERLAPNASLLDTSISIYRDNGNGNRELIASNDDYFSNDSFVRLHLTRGNYFVGVNASNNTEMDPAISESGFGGTSQGDYELVLKFEPDQRPGIVDTDGVPLDGDADGTPGGRFSFFFEAGPTIFVDKLADTVPGVEGTGSLTDPYDTIRAATEAARSRLVMPRDGAASLVDGESFMISDGINFPVTFEFDDNGFVAPGSIPVSFTQEMSGAELAAAIEAAIAEATSADPVLLNVGVTVDGDLVNISGTALVDASSAPSLLKSPNLVRIVGNGGLDGNPNTLIDNRPYLLGLDNLQPLADGASLEVPQGVTVMLDAGALFKLNQANIDVGTSAEGVDRREGALQVLGTPESRVSFYSYRNDLVGGDSDGPGPATSPGDWGGLVFRSDSDVEDSGIFLNWVNHAEIVSGGGKLLVESVEETFTPIHLIGARPTVSNNIIRRSADAAMSADPASFEESLGRVGPDIQGNLIVNNSLNGLFVRIDTELGSSIDRIELPSRWDDVDITHILTENLLISATPGGPIKNATTGVIQARLDGSLKIDPGVVVKLEGARIETLLGGQLIAEGNGSRDVIFTSLSDDSFGATSGTFDTKNDGDATLPAAGQWGGLFFAAMALGSLDHVELAYAGGQTPIEGDFDQFNAIEIHQADVRITNSIIRDNAAGTSSSGRNGRGTNAPATIFVRGAQPIIVDNLFQDNAGTVIHINANSLQAVRMPDSGRQTGELDRFDEFADNYGPLIRLNRLENNDFNAMEVRGAVLTTETAWDDTNIAHILRGEVAILNHHTFSGLHLLSNDSESLVVKLDGPNAGFRVNGTPLDIDDRIGGSIYIGGQGLPVVLTSLDDDSAIAGVDGRGLPLGDHNNDGDSSGTAGDWRGITLDRYSNDRNVATYRETEPAFSGLADLNRIPADAEFLGNLAPDEKSGDVNRRLGFEVRGNISVDNTRDVDVYSFSGVAGTEVFFDLDETSHSLDTILELVDATGTVLARSINSSASDLTGAALPLLKFSYLGYDFFSTSNRDAGMRVLLPGTPGDTNTYFVRVRSAPAEGDVENLRGGLTQGSYRLQVRLRQVDEKPGSFITGADIRYATTGIEVLGLPGHSPLLGESYETRAGNDALGSAQPLGNLLTSDRNTISVGGNISAAGDVDWYSFQIDYDLIQAIGGFNSGGKTFATIFDIDYADGLSRPDTVLSVFDAAGNLVLVSRDSNVDDDQPGPGQGADTDDLSRGSFGTQDAFIGSVQMPAGIVPAGGTTTYYVAVSSNRELPTALNGTFTSGASNTLVRLEPLNSLQRIAEDHIGFQGYTSGNFNGGLPVTPTNQLFDISTSISLATNVVPFTLNDVVLYTAQAGTNGLKANNAFTGQQWYNVGDLPTNNPGRLVGDLKMRNDGRLFMVESLFGMPGQNTAGRLVELDPATGAATVIGNDSIPDINPGANPPVPDELTSPGVEAFAWQFTGFDGTTNNYNLYYAVVGGRRGPGVDTNSSTLYRADPANGSAAPQQGQPWGVRGEIYAVNPGDLGVTTGMAFVNGQLFGVSELGLFYQIDLGSGRASNVINLGVPFSGLAEGPQNLDNGSFADILFASTSDGRIFAMDTAGNLQGVFQNGSNSSQTSTSPVGLAFSTLDFNLWHPTERRFNDPGHGINDAFDNSRDPGVFERAIGSNTDLRETDESEGGLSFYFGFETWDMNPSDANAYITYNGVNAQYGILDGTNHRAMSNNPRIGNNYDLPGGALGSLQTQGFSLAGYEAADKPTLYFNYFLETQNRNSIEEMRDSARVLISADGGNSWELLATNNSVLSPVGSVYELPSFISPNVEASSHPRQQVQELFDNTGGWRQARVDLSNYVGFNNLQFRFDFSTSGAMINASGQTQTGDPSSFGSLFDDERGLDNNFEGFYVDDVIVGFSERGEMVTNSGSQSSYFSIPQNPNAGDPSQILTGNYQLEIRRGTEYGENVDTVNPDIYIFQTFDTNTRLVPELLRLGDSNLFRDQGQLLIANNTISDSAEFGIVVDAASRNAGGSLSYPGGVRNLPVLNNQRLTAGVKLENNIIDTFGNSGIRFSGDPNTGSLPLASVPFGRIMNNTVFGGENATGTGIEITDNASPTVLNNIVANTVNGLTVDGSSSSTVIGANLFQGNTNNGSIGQNALILQPTDPLFVDPQNGNFYLAPGSLAIDSSLNSLADRPNFEAVNQPLGIPTSPILAPDKDRFGQLRLDDPAQDPPPGLGSNIFKDRGAVERADFRGPTARLIEPFDNDGLGIDLNPLPNDVLIQEQIIDRIVIQLQDTGIGVDDNSVTAANVTLLLDDVLLVEGVDYEFVYNATNNQILLRALKNNGPVSHKYDVFLDNTPMTGIGDLADNSLAPNRPTGVTRFEIITGGNPDDNSLPDFTLAAEEVLGLEDNEMELGIFPDPTSIPNFATDLPPAGGIGDPVIVMTTVSVSNPTLFAQQPAIDQDGTLTFLTAADQNGSAEIVVRLTETGVANPKQSAPQTFTITLDAVNDAPNLTVPASLDTIEDAGVVTVVGFASDFGAGPPTATDEVDQIVTITTLAANPSLFIVQPTIDTNGDLTFQTIQDYNSSMGEIIVTTFAEDDGPGDAPNVNRTDIKTFTINVAPINDPPSFSLTQSEVVVSEDQEEIDGTARTEIPGFATNLAAGPPTATDEVGQTLSFTLFSNAPELFEEQPAIDANGNLTFKTAKDRAGTAIVEAQLIDSGLGTPPPNDNTSQTATFTITITPVNDAPEFTVPAGLSVQEDAGNVSRPNFATGIRPGPASATDESGQLVRFEVEALNQASFAVQPSMSPDGTLTFRTATNANSANANFGVRVRLIDDGPGDLPNVNTSEYQTFTITVNPVNDAPIPNGYQTAGVEDSELVIQAADILDGDLPGPTPDETEGLIITQVEPVTAAGGTIVPVFNGNELVSLTYNPSRDFVGMDTFRYVVTDLGSPRMSATGTVTINVEGINDPPQFTIGSNRVVDEDFGPISFTGWARDILAGPPSALDELASQTVSFQVTAMDPSLFAVQPTVDSNGRLSFETALDANGSTEVVVVAVDDGSDVPPNINSSAAQTFTITVRPINDAPVFTAGADVSVDEDSGAYSAGWATNIAPAGGLLSNPPTATDEASQSISFTVSVDRPELFQQQPTIASNGTLSFTPAEDALGVAVLTITAVDSGPVGGSNVNTSTTETLTITIRGVNDAPVAVNDSYSTNENVVLGIGAPGLLENDTDVDLPDDALSAIPVTTTSELGAVVVISADGSFSYDPTKVDAIQRLTDGQSVSDSFQYQIRDLEGALSNFATVTINVAGIDDPPVAVDDTYSVGIGQALSLDVLANDFDIDSTIDRTSIEVVTLPIFGTFDVQPDGTILYTASPGSRGVDVLGYTVKDAAGNVSNEASVTITINNAPVAVDDSAFTVKNVPVDINVLANDSDVDGFLDPSTVNVVVAPSPSGTAEVLANGQIRFTPSAGFSGQARFSYVVSDNVGTVSNLAEVVVRVQNSAWQNPNGTLDVNNDSFVTPIDALLIINYLNGGGEQFLPDSGVTPPPFLDPNGDEFVTPVDALLIINALNRTSGGGSGEGEFDSQLDVMPITPAQMLQMVGPIALQPSSEHAESLRDALREEYLELVAAGESQQLKSGNSVSQLAGFQAFDDDSLIDALSCSLHEQESSVVEEAIDSMFSDGWNYGPQLPE